MTAQPHDPSTAASAAVEQAVALADAALGAAGHEVTDPFTRSVWHDVASGAITDDEGEARIMAHFRISFID
jgi:hypothetical protein